MEPALDPLLRSGLKGYVHVSSDQDIYEEGVASPPGKIKKKFWALKCEFTPMPYSLCLGDDVEMVDATKLVEKPLISRARGWKFALATILAQSDWYISLVASDVLEVFLLAKGWI